MRYRPAIVLAALCGVMISVPAMGAHGLSFVDGYAIPFADNEALVTQVQGGPFGGAGARSRFEDEGDGFGVKGQLAFIDYGFLSGEFQTVEFDDSQIELDQIRLGGTFGKGAGNGQGLYAGAEYVNFRFDFPGVDDDEAEDQNGFAGHIGFGLPLDKVFRIYGQVGYVKLDNLGGPEFLAGLSVRLGWNLSLFADYRSTDFEDDNGDDLKFDDLRTGVRLHF